MLPEIKENEAFKDTISVRNLVEFILKTGDLDNRMAGADMDDMQEGARIHRKLQKSMGAGYRAEVSLKKTIHLEKNDRAVLLTVEGRADGIYEREYDDGMYVFIDEIKSTFASLSHFDEPVAVHEAQAKCYAYFYAEQKELSQIGVQMTYCNIETEEIKRFERLFEFEELKKWFDSLVKEYSKWIFWQAEWIEKRNASIRATEFPFPYREGQRDLVGNVYGTIAREKNIFIEAPTGVGKTISTVFPSVYSMGENKSSKIFYLTAKTIARTVAEETFNLLCERGLKFKSITLTAKEKVCILGKPDCNPESCERAAGHFDRVNDAVFDLLTSEEIINREKVLEYAAKHNVCPFEMSLDVSLWTDAVICDYNYVFDPTASLKRFFGEEKKTDFILLIDEAHNLLERAREMFSATLVKEDFLHSKRLILGKDKRLEKQLEAVNRVFLNIKNETPSFQVWEECDLLYDKLQKLMTVFEDFLDAHKEGFEGKDDVLTLYFDVRAFMKTYEHFDESYRIYTDTLPSGEFAIKLLCMEPAGRLKERFDLVRTAVMFSATLLPMKYYKEQLGGSGEDFAIYAPSPFSAEKRLIMLAGDVSTRYTRRSNDEYVRIAEYLEKYVSCRTGNYLIFFTSYKMMEDILFVSPMLTEWKEKGKCVVQERDMTEREKEEYLQGFIDEPVETHVGLTVLGGIFSEGIDLTGERLTGAAIVGCGLPTVSNEKELFRAYFEDKYGKGFEYSYLYPGMNKVMQSAGRVIRTVDDVGTILLLDDRFLTRQYSELFPREWYPYEAVTIKNFEEKIRRFYDRQ